MKDEIFGAELERALDLAAKASDALLANLACLAADIDQVTGVDDERANVVFDAQLAHAMGLLWIDLGRAPHTRARRKDLEGVGADLTRALNGIRGASRSAKMHADALDHGISLQAIHEPARSCN